MPVLRCLSTLGWNQSWKRWGGRSNAIDSHLQFRFPVSCGLVKGFSLQRGCDRLVVDLEGGLKELVDGLIHRGEDFTDQSVQGAAWLP